MNQPIDVVVDGQSLTIDPAGDFIALVHQQGIRVDVPTAVEINSRNTIDCMEKMTQEAWVHISTGQLFQHLFKMLFPDGVDRNGNPIQTVKIPATIEELIRGDFGVTHICGMIVLGCEAHFAGKTKIFYRNPETYLHPRQEQLIVGMFKEMQSLLGRGTKVQVEELPQE